MKTIYAVLAFLLFTGSMVAQEFVPSFDSFSKKKLSYLTLENGEKITGYIKDLDRKKGLIEEIKIKDENGKKHKFEPEEIVEMYLPPSGFSKFATGMEKFYDVVKWDDTHLDSEKIKEGYAYFIKTDVMIKKKKKTLLLQLINPGFANKIQVFYDPYAKEAMGLGVGSFNVVGGEKKSYYVKVGKKVAYKLKKKNYKDQYGELFNGCKVVKKEYGTKWTSLAQAINLHSKECK